MASLQELQDESPVVRLLGMRILESDQGTGRVSMKVRQDFLQQAGAVQGGLIVTLADHALYLAVRSLLAPEQYNVTVELKLNFISSARDGELTAVARVISRGNRIVVGSMDVTNHKDELIAKGMGTCMVRSKAREKEERDSLPTD